MHWDGAAFSGIESSMSISRLFAVTKSSFSDEEEEEEEDEDEEEEEDDDEEEEEGAEV